MDKRKTNVHERLHKREIPELPSGLAMRSGPAWLLSLLLHVGMIATISLLWVSRPKGTSGEVDRPVGVAVVYEAAGGEAYFLNDAGAAQMGPSDSSPSEQTLVASLPTASDSVANPSLLDSLLPGSAASGDGVSQAAGGLGLGDGAASLGGNGKIAKLKTTVFGIEGEGTRFLYVFDRSESMLGYGGAPLRRAKSELLQSLDSLSESHQFQIIFYNDSPLPFGGMKSGGPKLFKGDEASKLAAGRFVRDVSAVGGTRHIEAIRMALAMGPDVLFFLTDADSSPSAGEVDDLQSRALRTGTTIHTIQFGAGSEGGQASRWLRNLAEGTQGKYRYIDSADLTR